MSGRRIYRTEIVTKEVKIPAGYVMCRWCKGKGHPNKYDEGWTSIVHDPGLAAPRQCPICVGLGYVAATHYEQLKDQS